jgi:hypothetical protein
MDYIWIIYGLYTEYIRNISLTGTAQIPYSHSSGYLIYSGEFKTFHTGNTEPDSVEDLSAFKGF